MHQYIICIGSNYERRANLLFARRSLSNLFPGIRFTAEQETRPLCLSNPALFTNQLAQFCSDAGEDDVVRRLKEIERSAGRCPEDKRKEVVRLDIDLLTFDGQIRKPEDWQREYVGKGLEELK